MLQLLGQLGKSVNMFSDARGMPVVALYRRSWPTVCEELMARKPCKTIIIMVSTVHIIDTKPFITFSMLVPISQPQRRAQTMRVT